MGIEIGNPEQAYWHPHSYPDLHGGYPEGADIGLRFPDGSFQGHLGSINYDPVTGRAMLQTRHMMEDHSGSPVRVNMHGHRI